MMRLILFCALSLAPVAVLAQQKTEIEPGDVFIIANPGMGQTVVNPDPVADSGRTYQYGDPCSAQGGGTVTVVGVYSPPGVSNRSDILFRYTKTKVLHRLPECPTGTLFFVAPWVLYNTDVKFVTVPPESLGMAGRTAAELRHDAERQQREQERQRNIEYVRQLLLQ